MRLPMELTKLAAWYPIYYNSHHSKYKSVYEFVIETSSPCICDECLESGEAIEANAPKQNRPGYRTPPRFAYWDKTRCCSTCKEYFVFDKEEQLFWYEELRFSIFSYAKNCQTCREENRIHGNEENALAQLIANLDVDDFGQLEAIVLVFIRRKNSKKAKFYLSHIPKLEGFETDTFQQAKHQELKEIIAQIKPY